MALKEIMKGKLIDRNRRGIIVLFSEEKGYKVAVKNYNCFSSENEDGGVYFAPYLSIDIRNSKLLYIMPMVGMAIGSIASVIKTLTLC